MITKKWVRYVDKEGGRFSCDLTLEPGDFLIIVSSEVLASPFTKEGKIETIQAPPDKQTVVRISAAWENLDLLGDEEEG